MNFKEFLEEKEKNRWKVHGIQVFHNQKIVEQDGDCTHRYPIYSATKTITSSAVGIAVAEGRFDIKKSLYDYMRDLIYEMEPGMVPQQKVELTRQLTIERLMTMSVGELSFRLEGAEWLVYALNALPDEIAKEEFHYSNISAYLVSLALQCALNQHLVEYLMPRFFEPLGIQKPIYQDDSQGFFYGASGMRLSVEELAKVGRLYLNRGVHHGRQILSEDWVEQATSSHIQNREGGYGYFIWKYHDGYRISGKWGQRSIVMPAKNLVITYLSDMEDGSEAVTRALEDYWMENF